MSEGGREGGRGGGRGREREREGGREGVSEVGREGVRGGGRGREGERERERKEFIVYPAVFSLFQLSIDLLYNGACYIAPTLAPDTCKISPYDVMGLVK